MSVHHLKRLDTPVGGDNRAKMHLSRYSEVPREWRIVRLDSVQQHRLLNRAPYTDSLFLVLVRIARHFWRSARVKNIQAIRGAWAHVDGNIRVSNLSWLLSHSAMRRWMRRKVPIEANDALAVLNRSSRPSLDHSFVRRMVILRNGSKESVRQLFCSSEQRHQHQSHNHRRLQNN